MSLAANPSPGLCQSFLNEMVAEFGVGAIPGGIIGMYREFPDAEFSELGVDLVGYWTLTLSACSEGDFDLAVDALTLSTSTIQAATARLNEINN